MRCLSLSTASIAAITCSVLVVAAFLLVSTLISHSGLSSSVATLVLPITVLLLVVVVSSSTGVLVVVVTPTSSGVATLVARLILLLLLLKHLIVLKDNSGLSIGISRHGIRYLS